MARSDLYRLADAHRKGVLDEKALIQALITYPYKASEPRPEYGSEGWWVEVTDSVTTPDTLTDLYELYGAGILPESVYFPVMDVLEKKYAVK